MLTWKWNYRNMTKFIPLTWNLLMFDVSYIIIHHVLSEKIRLLSIATSSPHTDGLLTEKEWTVSECFRINA